MVPRLFGGCARSLQQTMLAVEYTALWPAVCADARLAPAQRIVLAANTLELARVWAAYESAPAAGGAKQPQQQQHKRRPVVATRLSALAVAASAYYVPKLVTDEAALALRDSPVLAHTPCVTDADCAHAVLVENGYFRAFAAARRPLDELRCNMKRQMCNGLDGRR